MREEGWVCVERYDLTGRTQRHADQLALALSLPVFSYYRFLLHIKWILIFMFHNVQHFHFWIYTQKVDVCLGGTGCEPQKQRSMPD